MIHQHLDGAKLGCRLFGIEVAKSAKHTVDANGITSELGNGKVEVSSESVSLNNGKFEVS